MWQRTSRRFREDVVNLDEMISAEEAKKNQELCRKYPFLLPYQALVETDDEDFLPRTDAVSPDFDYSYTMLDFVPAGWQHLFLEMCEKIRQELAGTDEFDRIRFFEIKEKYGSLRLAATGGNRVTDAIIDRCEKDSQRICVQCGKPATRISKGWICPYCDDCIGDTASVAIE